MISICLCECHNIVQRNSTLVAGTKLFCFTVQEPSHKDARVDYVIEDMQIMSDFELHKLCTKYEVCEILIKRSK